MDRIIPVTLLALFFLALVGLALWGWRRRGARQAALPEPPALRDVPVEDLLEGPIDAYYANTVLAEQPYERVVAHGLGTRARVELSLTREGDWLLRREGARSFTIPAASVEEIGTAPGMSGKFVGGSGLFVIRWRLGEHRLDTGLRLPGRQIQDRLLAQKEHA